nr:MAG TPA_asm: hypothetical protein [Caudoviricetes sp.]
MANERLSFYERSCLHRWRGGSVVECSDMVIDI